VSDQDELMIMTSGGVIIRIKIRQVSQMGRATQGVKLIQLDEEDRVMDVARLVVEDASSVDQAVATGASAEGEVPAGNGSGELAGEGPADDDSDDDSGDDADDESDEDTGDDSDDGLSDADDSDGDSPDRRPPTSGGTVSFSGESLADGAGPGVEREEPEL